MQAKSSGADAPKLDVYADVTGRVIAQLEQGTIPWRKPWRCVDGTIPRNLVSGKPYRGVNLLLLSMSPYSSPCWVTWNQARKLKGQVRKGERSTVVVFWKMLKVEDPSAAKGHKTIPMLRYYRVFNVEQCDGLTIPESEPLPAFDPIAEAEAIWQGFKGAPPVSYGGDSACYMPQLDRMRMPVREGFETPQRFYCTLFHEGVHATGHPSRLGRFAEDETSHAFGSESYAREELVAEMGSAMLATVAGIDASAFLPQTAAYVASWLKSLKNDPKMVIQAAGKAQRAADFILGSSDDGSDHEDAQPNPPTLPEPSSAAKRQTAECPRCGKPCPVGSHQGAHCSACMASFRTGAAAEPQHVAPVASLKPAPVVFTADDRERLAYVVESSAIGVVIDLEGRRMVVGSQDLRPTSMVERRYLRKYGELPTRVHFTQAGPNAGASYCGAARDDRSRFMHVPYCREEELGDHVTAGLCPLCRDMAYGSEAETSAAVAKVAPKAKAKPKSRKATMGRFAVCAGFDPFRAWQEATGRTAPGKDVPVGLTVEYRGRTMRFESDAVPLKTLKLALS